MIGFVEWLDKKPFYVKNAWDFEKGRSVGVGRMQLAPHLRRIFQHCLTPDENGLFPYTTVILSAPKKSGKTTWSASIGAWYADCAEDGTEIYVLANSLDQVSLRVLSDIKFHCKKVNMEADVDEEPIKIKQYEIRYPNETFIMALASSYRTVAGSRHSLTLTDELWGFTCTTPDVECYTRSGWKRYDELVVGEEIATWNNGKFEWGTLNKVITSQYSGDLYILNHRRCNMKLTPNHRVLGRFRHNGEQDLHSMPYEILPAVSASRVYEGEVPTYSGWDGINSEIFTIPECYVGIKGSHFGKRFMQRRNVNASDWFTFVGYFLSEGHVIYTKKDGNPSAVCISQSNTANPDVCNRIRECLDNLGFVYTEKPGYFRIAEPQIAYYLSKLGNVYNKRVPKEMLEYSTSYLLNLFNAFMDGDGWQAGYGYQTELCNTGLLDDLIEIGLKCGYTCRYMGARKRKGGYMFRASFSKGYVCYNRNCWTTEHYEGLVWCPSVGNGTWLAKCNGFVYWTGNTEEAIRVWDEMTPIPTIPNSLRVVTTYAGFMGESKLLWDLYESGVGPDEWEKGKGEKIPGLEDLPCWRNGRQFTYWDHIGRMPWQTDEYYEEQMSSLRPSTYLRLHENQWVTSNETFIPAEWWDNAAKKFPQSADLWIEHPYRSYPVYVGVDGALKHDCTACVGVTLDPSNGKIIILFSKIWRPKPGDQLDLDTTLEAYLLTQKIRYNIHKVSYDPSQLQQTMLRLKGKGLNVAEFVQHTNNMIRASQALFDAFKEGNVWTYPDDDLRTHLMNAVAKEESRGFRIVKELRNRAVYKPQDGAIALAIAVVTAIDALGTTAPRVIRIESPFSDASAWNTKPNYNKLPWMFVD